MAELTIVVGARPNFMKAAPLIRALAKTHFTPRVLHTGQHYDAGMSDIFFSQLGVGQPDVFLEVGSGRHGEQTAHVLEAFEKYLLNAPVVQRGVVVVGDVNSTMACAITAAKLNIPVAHVEAGLRSFDRSMPEEINRIVTDAVSDLLFVSEPSGLSNLDHEGVPASKIHYVGNVMIDSLVHELPTAGQMDIRSVFGLEPHKYALVTLHRPSNVDNVQRSTELITFLLQVSKELPIVFPMHPRTRKSLSAAGLIEQLSSDPRIQILEPLGYRENLGLMMSAKVVLTDSGGIQEETSYLGIPCLTLRSNTERPITITHGTNTLVGDDLGRAYQEFANILAGVHQQSLPITGWDGHAAERIARILETSWNGGSVA